MKFPRLSPQWIRTAAQAFGISRYEGVRVFAGEVGPAWGAGWYPPERDAGGVFRWSRTRSTCRFYAPTLGRKLFLVVANTPEHGRSRVLRVVVNGLPAGERRLTWKWQNYLFPFEAARRKIDVEIRVDPPLDPEFLEKQDRRLDLGVAVSELGVLEPDALTIPGGLPPMPRWAIIEVTSACNIRCVMCAITAGLVPKGFLSWEAFERLRPLFPHLVRADLYGHGEPFLHKRLFDMLHEIGRHPCGTRIITNATLIDEEAASRLVACGLEKMIVSFDAASRGLFERIRGGASYDAVLENVRRVLRARDRAGVVRPRLQLQYMAMRMSIHEFPDFVRMAGDLGAERVSLVSLAEYERTAGESLRHHPAYARPFILRAQEAANARGVYLDLPMHELGGEREFEEEIAHVRVDAPSLAQTYPDGTPNTDFLFGKRQAAFDAYLSGASGSRVRDCHDPWSFLYVEQSGSVRPCCVSSQVMGYVQDSPVGEIWHGDRYRLFRRRFLAGEVPECRACPNRAWFPASLV